MSKTNIDKKVNRKVKSINKQLREDVFGNRFEVRQLQKARVDGIQYYLYEVRDNCCPKNNRIAPWQSGYSIFFAVDLFEEVNNVIIHSDFWETFYKNRDVNKVQ